MQEIFELYFQIADTRKDGRIDGQQATQFLVGTGLPQADLAKVTIASTQPLPFSNLKAEYSVQVD